MASLAELRTRIQRGFGDENQVVITNAEIDDLVNEAVREISKMIGLNSTTTNITTTDANGRIAVPADFLQVKEIRYNGLILPMIPRTVINARYTEVQQGEPAGWYLYNYNTIQLWPIKVSGTGLDISFSYVSLPATLVLTSDIPALPTYLHDAIVDYVVYQAYSKISDTEIANFYLGRFQKKLGDAMYLRDNPLEAYADSVKDTEAEFVIHL